MHSVLPQDWCDNMCYYTCLLPQWWLKIVSAAGPFSVFPVCVSQKDTRGVISTRVLKTQQQGTLERTTVVMRSDVT